MEHGLDLTVAAGSVHALLGEVVGIVGITGSGRESLLPAIFGAVPRESGTVLVGGTPDRVVSPAKSG